MRTWLKLLIGLTLVGASVAALIYLNRRKTTGAPTGTETSPALASQMWAVSDALQQSHINALASQVAASLTSSDVAAMIDRKLNGLTTGSALTRDEINSMIQQAITGLGTNNGGNNSLGTDTDLAALFNQQMA